MFILFVLTADSPKRWVVLVMFDVTHYHNVRNIFSKFFNMSKYFSKLGIYNPRTLIFFLTKFSL